LFLVFYVILIALYYFFIKRKNKEYDPNKIPIEVKYLILKYKIDINKINYKKLITTICFISPLVISITLSVVSTISKLYLQILFSIILLIPLILISYHIVGKHYQKRKVE